MCTGTHRGVQLVLMRTQGEREIFRRHAAEGVLLLGGGAAILLQLADPRVAAGVARHSGFRDRPLERLLGTLDYLTALAFGSEVDRRRLVRTVNAAHAPVRSRADDRGAAPRYSAFDADAQRWVASTLLAVALDLHERTWGRLDAARADAIVRGYAPLGSRLQGGSAGWPQTRAEFDEWWAERMSRLAVSDDARFVAHGLLGGGALPLPLRMPLPAVRLVTAALLPPTIREAYGFRWTQRAERVASAWLGAITTIWPRLPASLRHAANRASLRRVRRATRYAGTDLRGRG